jgi:phospholipid/cholesterol/gamma-HCH transport system permease protein
MVRSVAQRALLPTTHLLEEFGDMMILTGRTIVSALRPPYPYGGELVSQFLFVLRQVWFPLLVITADLGARKVREELDALQVLGVDPVKNLVVPRFLALMVATGLFDIYAVLFGLFGGILAELINGQPLGPFWNTLFANSSVTDLWGSVLKCTLFGAIIAIVCCYKGMSASGGAEGVGRAVNEAVVISFLGFGAFDYVFTQTLLATHPNILVIK